MVDIQRPPAKNNYEFYPQDYVAPGVVTLSKEALSTAKDFLSALQNFEPKAKWIVGFVWCTGRTIKRNATSATIDEGPGIDVEGFRYGELPTDTVEIVEGVHIIILLPPEIVAAAEKKTIVPTMLVSGRESFKLI